MIVSDSNKVSIVGTRNEIMQEFMCIAHTLVAKKIADSQDVLELTLLAVTPEKELKQAILETIDEMDDIGTALNLLGALSCLK